MSYVDLKIIRSYYLPEDVYEGDVTYRREDVEEHENIDPGDVIDILRREGVTFDGAQPEGDWALATNPDAIDTNYETGEQMDINASVTNAFPYELAAIIAGVNHQ